MVQFNLLPDVKLKYIKSRRTKRLVLAVSAFASVAAVGAAILLFVNVNIVQKRHLENLSNDIQARSEKLKNEKDIDKILTVQNQLNTINALHDAKPAADRIDKYLSTIMPTDVSLTELSVDYATNTMRFTGEATSLKAVNKFIDTMKFAEYVFTEKDSEGKNVETKGPAFSSIVLTSSNRNDGDNGKPVEYEINLMFDPLIFDIKKIITLKVPDDKLTTRSVTEKPDSVFRDPKTSEGIN